VLREEELGHETHRLLTGAALPGHRLTRPLAHPLPLDHVEVAVEIAPYGAAIRSRIVVTARTGAEMEAMVACAGAALALYDMVKAVERGAVIADLRLEAKSGGKSGEWRRRPGRRQRSAE